MDDVGLSRAAARPTVVVAAGTTWQQLPALWPALLGEVWDCLRAGGVTGGCRNVMLYRDAPPGVEIEVGVTVTPVTAPGAAGR